MDFGSKLRELTEHNMAAISHFVEKYGEKKMAEYARFLAKLEDKGYSIAHLDSKARADAAMRIDAEEAEDTIKMILLILERFGSRGPVKEEFREKALAGAARSLLRSFEDDARSLEDDLDEDSEDDWDLRNVQAQCEVLRELLRHAK